MTRYQTQAVLRRSSSETPLLLVGVTLDSSFYPLHPRDARGRFVLTKGLVALAPLTPVEAQDAGQAASIALVDAAQAWDEPCKPDEESAESVP